MSGSRQHLAPRAWSRRFIELCPGDTNLPCPRSWSRAAGSLGRLAVEAPCPERAEPNWRDGAGRTRGDRGPFGRAREAGGSGCTSERPPQGLHPQSPEAIAPAERGGSRGASPWTSAERLPRGARHLDARSRHAPTSADFGRAGPRTGPEGRKPEYPASGPSRCSGCRARSVRRRPSRARSQLSAARGRNAGREPRGACPFGTPLRGARARAGIGARRLGRYPNPGPHRCASRPGDKRRSGSCGAIVEQVVERHRLADGGWLRREPAVLVNSAASCPEVAGSGPSLGKGSSRATPGPLRRVSPGARSNSEPFCRAGTVSRGRRGSSGRANRRTPARGLHAASNGWPRPCFRPHVEREPRVLGAETGGSGARLRFPPAPARPSTTRWWTPRTVWGGSGRGACAASGGEKMRPRPNWRAGSPSHLATGDEGAVEDVAPAEQPFAARERGRRALLVDPASFSAEGSSRPGEDGWDPEAVHRLGPPAAGE